MVQTGFRHIPRTALPGAFAERLSRSAVWRHLLFLAATFFTIAFLGYHFGTGDQVIHIPFLKQAADPSLYPNDPFLALRHLHYSYFWFAFLPFYQWGLLEPAMFVTHVAATYATFWAFWALSEELFGDALTNLLAVVILALPHIGFGGWPQFEFSMLNRTVVLPMLLLTLILYLRGRYWLTFTLLGLLFNLHVISVNFVLAMLLLASVMEWRRVGARKLLVGLSLFVVCALPVLIWKGSESPLDLTVRPDWMNTIARGALANIYYMLAPVSYVVLATLSGLSTAALYLIGRGAAPSVRHNRTVTWFMVAAGLILAVAVVTQWAPVTILVQSQIIRAGVFVLLFAHLYLAHLLALRYQAGAGQGADWWVLLATAAGSILAVAPLSVWAVQRWVKAGRARTALSLAVYAAMTVFTFALAISLKMWSPGIYIYARQTPWVQAQLWARENTPKDAVFIATPHLWWWYTAGWRVFSERASVAELSDLIEISFAPEYLPVWRKRYEALAPGALDAYAGNLMANWGIGARAFYGLPDDAIVSAARVYDVDYLVVDRSESPPRPWPVAYANEQYAIYDLRGVR